MKKTVFKVAGSILAVILLGWLVRPAVQDYQHRQMEAKLAGRSFAARDFFPLSVGQQWTYDIRDGAEVSRVTVEVLRQTEAGGRPAYEVLFGDQATKLLGYNATGLVKYREADAGEEEVYDPLGVILPDLEYGKARTFHPAYTMRSAGSADVVRASAEMSFWVEAVETVRVPAGTFPETLRIGYYDRWEEQDGSFDISRGRIWFAKGVGIVKISGKEMKVDRMRGAEETSKETHVLRAYRPGTVSQSGNSDE